MDNPVNAVPLIDKGSVLVSPGGQFLMMSLDQSRTRHRRFRVFHASSTAPVPMKPKARWAKGGKRNSARIEWGDVSFPCHAVGIRNRWAPSDIEWGDVPSDSAITSTPVRIEMGDVSDQETGSEQQT